MFHPLRLVPALLVILPTLCIVSSAQPLPDDDGTLYFPPKLTVFASATSNPRRRDRGDGSISMRRAEDRRIDFLLPIIFFDGPGNTTISNRYQTFFSAMETDDYTDSGDVIDVPTQSGAPKYAELLNVIGYRMTAFPASRIELEGGYSTLPGEAPEVGSTRAEVVRDYLTTIWHIQPERITLRPPRRICDSSATILRQEEAQRVVMIPSTPELIKPVSYFQVRTQEELVFFRVVVDPSMDPADVASIELVISMEDQIVSSTEIPGHPDSTVYNLQGLWPAFQLHRLTNTSLVVQAFVRTWRGTTRQSNPVRVAVNANLRRPREADPINPFESTYFSVPFFDWRDSSLTGLQQYYLEEYVRAFRAGADERAGQPHVIRVIAKGERSEDAGINEAAIVNMRSFQSFQSTIIKSLFAPQNQFPVVFFSGEEEPEPEVIVKAWLGEDYIRRMREQEQARESEELEEDSYGYGEEVFDSTMREVIAGRGNRIAQYLQERIGADLHDSITVAVETEIPYSYNLFPDERYYERRITIELEPFYEYDEEDYDENYPADDYVPDEAVPAPEEYQEATQEEYQSEE